MLVFEKIVSVLKNFVFVHVFLENVVIPNKRVRSKKQPLHLVLFAELRISLVLLMFLFLLVFRLQDFWYCKILSFSKIFKRLVRILKIPWMHELLYIIDNNNAYYKFYECINYSMQLMIIMHKLWNEFIIYEVLSTFPILLSRTATAFYSLKWLRKTTKEQHEKASI